MPEPVPVVWLKKGVRFAERPLPGGIRIVSAIDQATLAIGQSLLMTSAADSHTSGRHPTGEAYDVSTNELDVATVLRLYDFFQKKLGERFTVLYESPVQPLEFMLRKIATINPDATAEHFHLQPKKGTEFPPGLGISGRLDV